MEKKQTIIKKSFIIIIVLILLIIIARPIFSYINNKASENTFRYTVRGALRAIELKNSVDSSVSGTVADLNMHDKNLSGTWSINDGIITLTNACNNNFCVQESVTNINYSTDFKLISLNK